VQPTHLPLYEEKSDVAKKADLKVGLYEVYRLA
jgi:hypothetical protein